MKTHVESILPCPLHRDVDIPPQVHRGVVQRFEGVVDVDVVLLECNPL